MNLIDLKNFEPPLLAIPVVIEFTHNGAMSLGCLGLCTVVLDQAKHFNFRNTECIFATVLQNKLIDIFETVQYVVPFEYITSIDSSDMLPELPLKSLRQQMIVPLDQSPPVHRWHHAKIIAALTDLGMQSGRSN
jgi:hypothetical protein